MLVSSDVSKMNFEELKEFLAIMASDYEKFKRKYRQDLENISEENLSETLLKKINGLKAEE